MIAGSRLFLILSGRFLVHVSLAQLEKKVISKIKSLVQRFWRPPDRQLTPKILVNTAPKSLSSKYLGLIQAIARPINTL